MNVANSNAQEKRRLLSRPVIICAVFILLGVSGIGICLLAKIFNTNTPTWALGLIFSCAVLCIVSSGLGIIYFFRRMELPPVVAGPLTLSESAANNRIFLFCCGVVLLFNFFGYLAWQESGLDTLTIRFFFFILLLNFLYLFVLFLRLAPKPRLTLRSGDLRAGGRLDLAWKFNRTACIAQLSISLHGYYCYDRYETGRFPVTFADYSLLPATDDPQKIRNGELTFTLPADLCPSGRDANSDIVWSITVKQKFLFIFISKRLYPVIIRGQV